MDLAYVRVQFQSQNPHKTLFLKVWVDANNEPQEMYAALEKVGFAKENTFPVSPVEAQYHYGAGYAKGDTTLIATRTFSKKGTGLFNGWTLEEAKKNVPAVRSALRKFGFVRINHRKLTLADSL